MSDLLLLNIRHVFLFKALCFCSMGFLHDKTKCNSTLWNCLRNLIRHPGVPHRREKGSFFRVVVLHDFSWCWKAGSNYIVTEAELGVCSILSDTMQAWGIGSLISKFRVSCVGLIRSGLLSNCQSCCYNFLVYLPIGVPGSLVVDSVTFISLGFLKPLAFEAWQVS